MSGVVAADLGVLAVRVVTSVESGSLNSWFVVIVERDADEVASDLHEEISALTTPTGTQPRWVPSRRVANSRGKHATVLSAC